MSKGFDIIIGNPPYKMNSVQDPEKSIIRNDWNPYSMDKKTEGGSHNLSAVFLERASKLLRKNGYFGYIVNNTVARIDEFKKVREYLLENTKIKKIIDEGNPFRKSGVTLEMITIISKREKGQNEIFLKSHRDFFYENSVPQGIFHQYNRFIIYYDEIFHSILNTSFINVLSGTRGQTYPKRDVRSDKFSIPYYYSGKSVKKYRTDPDGMEYTNTKGNGWGEEGIVVTKIFNRYRGIIKDSQSVIGDGVSKIECSLDIRKKSLLFLLNSRCMDYIMRRYITNMSDLTLNIVDSITMMTPIPKIFESLNFKDDLCDYMAFLTQTNPDHVMKSCLEFVVYELFFFPTHSLYTILSAHCKPIQYDEWNTLHSKSLFESLEDTENERMNELLVKNTHIINNTCDKINRESWNIIGNIINNIKRHTWVKYIENNWNT